MSGIHLITLPIGNSKDITIKAFEILKELKYIYCEDTRVFRELAKKIELDVSGKYINSFHDHSGNYKLEKIIELAKTEEIGFVSDAGSPYISDPGYPLVQAAYDNNIPVHSFSGISAVTNALELSGLAPIPYIFHGFLARDRGKIEAFAEQIKSIQGTHIFFEGLSRVKSTLSILSQELPENSFVVCREMTKSFESVYRFQGKDYKEHEDEIVEKGEFVILVEQKESSSHSSKELLKIVDQIYAKGTKPKLLAKLISEITGENTKEVYEKISLKK